MELVNKFNQKKYSEIIALYNPNNIINKNNFLENLIIAKSFFLNNDFDKALIILKTLNTINQHHEVKYVTSLIYQRRNQLQQSYENLKEAINLKQDEPLYLNEMAVLLIKNNQIEAAFKLLSDVRLLAMNLSLKAQVFHNIALCYSHQKNFEEAIKFYKKSLELNKNSIGSIQNLGMIYYQKEEFSKAKNYFNEILKIQPASFTIKTLLALIELKKNKFYSAINLLLSAIQDNNEYKSAWENLAHCYYLSNQASKAVDTYRKVIELNKLDLVNISNYLNTLNYCENFDSAYIFNEHNKYANLFEQSHPNSLKLTDPSGGKIKIGFVSADFRKHSVMEFFLPLLNNFNRQLFDIYCYSNHPIVDDYTKVVKNKSHFLQIHTLSDEEVSKQIKEDKIDILFDLSGHTSHNRLGVFSRRSSPIQISWIGYAATTGLPNMDFKIVDKYTDTLDQDKFYSEKLIRMPDFFMCFKKPESDIQIETQDKITDQSVIFGSFNHTIKISEENIKTWSAIISSNSNYRLCLKHKSLENEDLVNDFKKKFISYGVKESQLIFLGYVSKQEHFELYNKTHIVLDTSPYNGTTTTMEALWMGVPVVTQVGEKHQSRVSHSILNNIGVPELSAVSKEEYIKKAIELSNDFQKIIHYKKTLREALLNSPIMDEKKFMTNFENIINELVK